MVDLGYFGEFSIDRHEFQSEKLPGLLQTLLALKQQKFFRELGEIVNSMIFLGVGNPRCIKQVRTYVLM